MKRLPASEQNFLGRVREVAFGNPFAPEHRMLQRRLADLPPEASNEAVTAALSTRLGRALDLAARAGLCRLQDVAASDRETFEFAWLFQLLLLHLPDLDRTLTAQINGEGSGCPSAGPILAKLQSLGYDRDEACRRFAMLFQVRRGYYFVDRGLVGRSPCMVELRRRLWNNIFTHDIRWYVGGLWERMEDFSLLLLGETGTGKGAAAAAVGRSAFLPWDARAQRFSVRPQEAFLEINLSQYATSLLESELFGHRRGAFTGASENHEGVLSQCPPFGSVFMDEIGEVSAQVQIKLLRVLQERRFHPVGAHESRRFAGRVIAATNRPLTALLNSGAFREDFFHRLSSDCVEVPTLRQRLQEDPEELPLLARFLLQRLLGRDDEPFLASVLDKLTRSLPDNYPWPGNVRELEQALRRILLTGAYSGLPQTTGVAEAAAGFVPVRQRSPDEWSALIKSLHDEHGTLAAVARLTGLDRRTVRRYLDRA